MQQLYDITSLAVYLPHTFCIILIYITSFFREFDLLALLSLSLSLSLSLYPIHPFQSNIFKKVFFSLFYLFFCFYLSLLSLRLPNLIFWCIFRVPKTWWTFEVHFGAAIKIRFPLDPTDHSHRREREERSERTCERRKGADEREEKSRKKGGKERIGKGKGWETRKTTKNTITDVKEKEKEKKKGKTVGKRRRKKKGKEEGREREKKLME